MYELIQHTADIRIRVVAPTIEELFRDALRGLMHFVAGRFPEATTAEPIEVEALDHTTLLVDFLNEALLRTHLHRTFFSDVTFDTLGEDSLKGTLHGGMLDEMAEDVKAVTYHEADVRREGGQWTTTLVLDV